MNISGIVVAVPPQKFQKGIEALNALNNVEVFQTDKTSGQIVVVQEAEGVNQEIDGLKTIKSLPMVTYAEMVYHYVAEDGSLNVIPPDDIEHHSLEETLKKLNS